MRLCIDIRMNIMFGYISLSFSCCFCFIITKHSYISNYSPLFGLKNGSTDLDSFHDFGSISFRQDVMRCLNLHSTLIEALQIDYNSRYVIGGGGRGVHIYIAVYSCIQAVIRVCIYKSDRSSFGDFDILKYYEFIFPTLQTIS